MISLIKFVFGVIFLLFIAATVLYWLNKPLLMHMLEHLKETFGSKSSRKPQHRHDNAGNGQSSRLESKEREAKIESQVSQALNEIRVIQRAVDNLTAKLEDVSNNVSILCMQFKDAQNQNIMQRETIPTPHHQEELVKSDTQENMLASQPQQMYAFAPSSISPYGFSQNDWSEVDNDHTFVMKRVSPNEAKFTINNKVSAYSQVLNNLAYLDRLIECENAAPEGTKPKHAQTISLGRLRLQDSVWVIQHKIKIKIY